MGRSRRFFAAVALILGCVVGLAALLDAPANAAPTKPASGATQGPRAGTVKEAPAGRSTTVRWTSPRMRIEPVEGTEGVSIAGIGTFRGAIEVARNGGRLTVVNEVGFEDYVRGISEVPSEWPLEALKAQAIAARTYAMWEFHRQAGVEYKQAGAHICATQGCQVYTGLTKERAPAGDRWTAAVEATKNQVLWWRNAPIVAKYSSSNGGEIVDGGRPYLRSGRDPDDAHSPFHRWHVVVPADQLAAVLGLPGRVTAIQRSGDDVLVTAMVDPANPTEEPSHLNLHALAFRDLLNEKIPAPGGLPRTLPTVRFGPAMTDGGATVTFAGRGWGHGIGMSQWGAYGKAQRGMKAPDILAAYYAGLRPVALPDAQVPQTIKVALALDTAQATMTASNEGGRLRVIGGDGAVLDHGAAGTLWVNPASPKANGGVTVIPAAGHDGPAAVALDGDASPHLTVGQPVELKLLLTDHATFSARALAPGGSEPITVGQPQLFPAGHVVLRLPAPETTGQYSITVDTDRGGGRVGSTTLSLEVVAPAAAPAETQAVDAALPAAAAASDVPRFGVRGTVLLALAALAIVGAAASRIALGQRRPRPLH